MCGELAPATCRICGVELPRRNHRVCANPECKRQNKRLLNVRYRAGILTRVLTTRPPDPRPRCVVCGTPIPKGHRTLCGSADCRRERNNVYVRAHYWRKQGRERPEPPSECVICHKPIDNSWGSITNVCSRACYRERARLSVLRCYYRKRARQAVS